MQSRYFQITALAIFSLFATNVAVGQLDRPVEIGSSPNPVGSGARAMGQANAFIAVADDATAASWNPGGLTQLERPEFSFALESIARREHLRSSTHPESNSRDALDMETLNYASVVVPVYLGRHMVFSLNYLKVYNFDKSAEFDYADVLSFFGGMNRKFRVDFQQEGNFSVVAPAFAIDVTPKLSLGITLNCWKHSLTRSSRYKSVNNNNTAGDAYEISLVSDPTIKQEFTNITSNTLEVEDGYSLVLGGIYRINKEWAIAGVVKPRYTLDIASDGVTYRDQSGDLGTIDPPEVTPNSDDVDLNFPWIIGVGAAWRPSDPLTVSMDVTWTDWSNYSSRDSRGKRNPIVGTKFSDGNLDDTFTGRLGFEYLVILEEYLVPIRWGLGYDPQPATGDVDDFYTLNLGMGIQIKERVNLDVAYEYRWGDDVNGDVLRQVNGTQDVRQHRVLASMIYYF